MNSRYLRVLRSLRRTQRADLAVASYDVLVHVKRSDFRSGNLIPLSAIRPRAKGGRKEGEIY